MHALVSFLIFVLVSSLQLLNPTLVEARKLNSNGFFAIDLIHRDSPLSPYYNSMTPQEHHDRSIRGSLSHGHRIHLSSAFYDTKDDVNGNLVPNGGDYLIKIAIGTPPMEFVATADTGSDLIWLQCTPCQTCIQQQSPLFDPHKSSTYQTIPCTSQSCSYADLVSGCPRNNQSSPCLYLALYGDGTNSTGYLATDTISFTSTDTALTTFPSSVFGCGFDQHGRLGIQGDGIVGLGGGPLSLVSQLGPKINYKFSYCLNPLSSMITSKLNFGVGVTSQGVVSTPFTTGNTPDYYNLMLDSISITDNSMTVGQNIIIDSGTTYTYLHSSVYQGVRDAMIAAIELNPVADADSNLDLCFETGESGDQGFNPPDVVFHFAGADVVLKATNTFRKIGSFSCLAMVAVEEDDTMIFGNIAQVNFEVGYALQAKEVSFAPADCTKY